MRTERRHELQTNTLAKDLELGLEKFRPYTNQILAAIGAVLLLFAALSYWRNSQLEQEQAAWEALQSAMLSSELELTGVQKLIEDETYAGLATQEWAAVTWADRQLRIAANDALIRPEAASDKIDAVAGIYRQFSASASSDEIRNRARLGLARVHELRSEVDEAIAAYQRVEGEFKEIAQDRIESLERASGIDAVKWLASAKFELPRGATGPGTPGVRPQFSPGEPAADAAGEMEFDPTRSLEEILGGLSEAQGDARYDDKDAEPADESPAADAKADDDAADESDDAAEQ
ncbi:MAG: hypothetical protein KF847_17835 [Pirellulales bacterium]|nr:hypothetical protein [Pirellulales bacterium]